MKSARGRRRGLRGWLKLCIAVKRMQRLNQSGKDLEIIRLGNVYLNRWKGDAVFYGLLAGAHWGESHWKESVHYGRLALRLDPKRPQTVVFILASYRSMDPLRGIGFGEQWLSRQAINAEVCRHLSLLYDDLDRSAEALATARRGLTQNPDNRRLAACAANYLAKVEGAASALRFAEDNRHLFSGDTYSENTVAKGLSSIRAYAEAEKIFSALHRRHPRDSDILESLLDAWFRLHRHREILNAVEIWERSEPMTAALANEAGRSCLELNRHDEALVWMGRAVDLAPGNGKFADNYAISLGRAGRYVEGIDATRRRLAAPDSPDRRRLLTSLAVDHTQLGRHEEALCIYEQVFAEFPEDGDALVNVIVGLTWLDRFEDAVTSGMKHLDTGSGNPPLRLWSELAWSLHRLSRFNEERALIEKWSALHPDDREVVRTMKRARNSLGDRDGALVYVREWVAAHPTEARGWRYLAEQHEVCGDPDAEILAAAEACRLAPDDPAFAAARLITLRRLNRAREAFEIGCAWIGSHPKEGSAVLFNRIGLAADDLEQWTSAEEYYGRAHRCEPTDGAYLGNLLRALISQSRAAEAVELGRRWLNEYPWDNYVAGKLAWALRSAELLDEEAEVLRKAVQTDPRDHEMNFALLTNLISRNRTEEAGDWVECCNTGGNAAGRLHNDWANHLRDLGRFAEAEVAYQKGLQIAPDNDVVAGNLASLLIHRERADEAVRLCREWLGRRPDDWNVRRQLANAFYAKDDFEAGEPEFQKLLVHEPQSGFYVGRLAACLRLQAKYEEALAASERWLAQSTGTAFLYIEAGISAQRLNRLAKALGHFKAALKLEPSSFVAAVRTLNVLAAQNEVAAAVEFGLRWKSDYPAEAPAPFFNELGILLDRLGRTEEAQQSFLRAVELEPANAAMTGNAVEILARRGQVAESIQVGQLFFAMSPPDAYLLRRLAEVYSKQSEHTAALDLLKTAATLEPADPDIAAAFLRTSHDADELDRGVAFGRAWLDWPGNDGHATVWVRYARLCFRAGNEEEALAAVAKATEIEPDEIEHIRLRFGFWNASGESNQVVREFESLRKAWQEDSGLLRYLSRAYREIGLNAEALTVAIQNLEANPADDEACAWLADLRDRSGQSYAAKECLRGWINLHGEQTAVVKIRARIALRENHYESALADAESVLRQDKSDEESFVISVLSLRGLGREREAQLRLNHWLEHHEISAKITRLLDEKMEGEIE